VDRKTYLTGVVLLVLITALSFFIVRYGFEEGIRFACSRDSDKPPDVWFSNIRLPDRSRTHPDPGDTTQIPAPQGGSKRDVTGHSAASGGTPSAPSGTCGD
jgi:hypothetical protein